MEYKIYKFSKSELLKNLSAITIILLVIAKMFYGSFVYAILLLPLLVPALKLRKKQLCKKRREVLASQFKDMLISMSDAMIAGNSTVTALKEAYKEMVSVYGTNSYICQELRIVMSRMKLNISMEDSFADMAGRAGIEDINLFVSVFTIAQKRGGNMVSITKSVADNIRQKAEVKEEIMVCINAKIFEERIMSIVPLLIIGYMLITSPGFLDVMYATWIGKIIMTACLAAYFIAVMWAEKIMSIEV